MKFSEARKLLRDFVEFLMIEYEADRLNGVSVVHLDVGSEDEPVYDFLGRRGDLE